MLVFHDSVFHDSADGDIVELHGPPRGIDGLPTDRVSLRLDVRFAITPETPEAPPVSRRRREI